MRPRCAHGARSLRVRATGGPAQPHTLRLEGAVGDFGSPVTTDMVSLPDPLSRDTLPDPPPPAAVHARVPWPMRLRELLSGYLPLVLMLLLALATWWLVKNAPHAEAPAGPVIPRHVPDYTMRHFTIQRFATDGRLRVRIEGERLRHYPDTDTIEIDTVRIHAVGDDGRVTEATARRALSNGDASEVQLLGGAHVVSEQADAPPIEFEGEFLEAFLRTERVRSTLPVQVRQGGSVVQAQGLDYDNLSRVGTLAGRVQARFAPAARGGARAVPPAAAAPSAAGASSSPLRRRSR